MNTTDHRIMDYIAEGPADAPVLVFVHGWPDDASLWRKQVAVLKDKYRCIVPTLPNFGATPAESGGCDFPEIIARLHATIASLGDGPVTLVIHDWGAYIGYLYEKQHPERVTSVVAMDIGGEFAPDSIKSAAMFVSYQWMLIALWLIGGLIPPLGTALTRGFARLLKVPERQAGALESRNNYPYFYFWRATLLPWLRSRLIGRCRPQCPVLFIYGGQKPLMFHSERWLEIVENTGGRNVCIESGSHWFMETHADDTNALLTEWLAQHAAT